MPLVHFNNGEESEFASSNLIFKLFIRNLRVEKESVFTTEIYQLIAKTSILTKITRYW